MGIVNDKDKDPPTGIDFNTTVARRCGRFSHLAARRFFSEQILQL